MKVYTHYVAVCDGFAADIEDSEAFVFDFKMCQSGYICSKKSPFIL